MAKYRSCPSVQKTSKCQDKSYVLVQFEGSPKVYVENICHIKEANGVKLLKWNGARYKVRVLAVHKNKSLLHSLAWNLNFAWPRIPLVQHPTNTFQVNLDLPLAQTETCPESVQLPENCNTFKTSEVESVDNNLDQTSIQTQQSNLEETSYLKYYDNFQEAYLSYVGIFNATSEAVQSDFEKPTHSPILNPHSTATVNIDQNFANDTELNSFLDMDNSNQLDMNHTIGDNLDHDSPINASEKVAINSTFSNSVMGTPGNHNQSSSTNFELFPSDGVFNFDTEMDVDKDACNNVNTNFGVELDQGSSDHSKVQNNTEGRKHAAKTRPKRKQHCCLYCGIKTVTLSRHLLRKHKNEEEVKKAISHDAKSQDRLKCLEKIRKEGDYMHNKSINQNIVVRNSSKPTLTTYLPCKSCNGYYSVKNLRHHVRKFCSQNPTSKRNVVSSSYIKGSFIHPLACENLKTLVFPSLRDVPTLKLVTSDPTAVMFGNSLAGTYLTLSQHHSKMIAAQFRLLAKVFLTIQSLESSIIEIKQIFSPTKYNTVVEAIRKIGGFDGAKYRTPTIVHQACTLLKKIANFVKCLKIKEGDKKGMKEVENFLFLLKTSQNSDLTKMATEIRTRHQRTKKEVLPTTSEINNLVGLLEKDIDACYKLLSKSFDKELWIELSQLTLIYILVFNRKRPGDVQRTEIVEYKTVSTVAKEDTLNLSENEKFHASNFARYIARGKLNRSASILLSIKVKSAIDLLLFYREAANVNKENKFLFADPKHDNTFYLADIALKKYCASKQIPVKKFTATNLRKHLATSTASLPLNTQSVISDFMGHGQEIHNNIYKQRDAYIDIITMGQVLTDASGSSKTNVHESAEYLQSGDNSANSVSNNQINVADCLYTNEESQNVLYKNSFQEKKTAKSNCKMRLSTIFENNENALHENPSDGNGYVDNTFSMAGPSTSSAATVSISTYRLNHRTPSPCSSAAYSPTDSENSNSSCNTEIYKSVPVRKTWSTPERQTVRDVFSDYFNNAQVPDQSEIQHRKVTTELQNLSRSIPHIQNWIHAEIHRSKRGKKGWTTPQKIKCREYFSEYYKKTASSIYPPVRMLKEAIATIPEFQGKTVATLRSQLQHDFVYVANKVN